ncbi:MAG: hypothetical protein IJQ71_09620 [Clostridia bacterium]|nr:hypothetical protein [Clostridia bacterium]
MKRRIPLNILHFLHWSRISRYFGKPILATDPNFIISSGFLAENFRRWHSSTEERQRKPLKINGFFGGNESAFVSLASDIPCQ